MSQEQPITEDMLRAGLAAWQEYADHESRVALSRMYRAMQLAGGVGLDALDARRLDFLEAQHVSLTAIKEPCGDDETALWWQVTKGRKSLSGHVLPSARAAIDAALAAEGKKP